MARLVKIDGSDNWYVAYAVGRSSKRISTGTTDKVEAERFLAEVEAKLRQPPKPTQQVIGKLLDAYREDRVGEVNALATIDYAIKKLKASFQNVQPQHFTVALGNGYIKKMRKNEQSDGTTRRELGVLRAAFAFGERHRWYEKAPYVPMPGSPEPRDRWLTREEADKLVEACAEPHIRLFILLGIHTGARKSAILQLTWDRVDFQRGLVSYHLPGKRTTKKRRGVVPINDTLMAELKQAFADRTPTCRHVIEWRGEPVANVKTGFRRSVERAGLEDVTPHTLRHTCATWMIQAGVPFEDVALFLADSVQMIRKVYGHHSPDWLRGASNALQG